MKQINIFGGGIAGTKNEFFVTKLYGFSVACEGEDKFAVAREGKCRKIGDQKSNTQNLLND